MDPMVFEKGEERKKGGDYERVCKAKEISPHGTVVLRGKTEGWERGRQKGNAQNINLKRIIPGRQINGEQETSKQKIRG